MPKLIILGSSNAVPTQESENTHMVLAGSERMVLIDSPSSSSIVRLEQAGLDFNALTDIIVTHFHPDHTLGIPALLLDMWILGRKRPLRIHGLPYTLERVKALLNLYDWSGWGGFYPVEFCRVSEEEKFPVLDCSDFTIHASPVRHGIPNIGIRVGIKHSQKVIAYSSDTEPCDEVIRMSAGADILIHDAGGELGGHSSAYQAGEIARKAEVSKLLLIHYPTGKFSSGDLVSQAKVSFSGEVALARDFMVLDLSRR